MSLLKSGPFKIAFGFGLGVMSAEVLKELIPVFRELRRPLLKAAVQSSEILARNGRVKLAEFREALADVKAEMQGHEPQQAPAFDEPPARAQNQASEIM